MTLIYVFTVVLILAALIGMSAYLFAFIRRFTKSIDKYTKKRWIKNLATLGISALIILCIFIHNSLVVFVIYFIIFSVIIDLIHLIGKKIIKTENKSKPVKVWIRIHNIYILPIIFATAMMIYGHYNMMNIDRTAYTVSTQKNIRAEGYRIGMIADLHLGSTIDLTQLKNICNDISNEDIDIMILCGDIVDEYTSASLLEPLFKILGNIDAPYGTYFVHGNHDCQTYKPNPSYTKEELEKHITDNGIIILEDKVLPINEEFIIAGRNDASHTNSSSRLSLDELLKDVDKNDYILVLDHQPKEYKENANYGTDLLLSGHTHAGQFWPLNYVLEFIPYNDGLYGIEKIKNTTTIITSGISGWGFPYRTSADSEYLIIDIKPE